MQRPQGGAQRTGHRRHGACGHAIEAGRSWRTVTWWLMTGDAIDNAQRNELATLSRFSPGHGQHRVGRPGARERAGAVVARRHLLETGRGRLQPRPFRIRYAFRTIPACSTARSAPFRRGSARPVDRLPGNHELLARALAWSRLSLRWRWSGQETDRRLPRESIPTARLELFTAHPEAFMTGPSVAVTPDAATAGGTACRTEVSGARHRGREAHPPRHLVPVRGADGRIDGPQLAWLERASLKPMPPTQTPSGQTVRTSNPNRLVVILSHHPLSTLRNERAPGGSGGAQLLWPARPLPQRGAVAQRACPPQPGPAPRQPERESQWASGRSRRARSWTGPARAAGRAVRRGGGRLAIACTMIDHDGAVDPGTP